LIGFSFAVSGMTIPPGDVFFFFPAFYDDTVMQGTNFHDDCFLLEEV
jgi:hypothetical protein